MKKSLFVLSWLLVVGCTVQDSSTGTYASEELIGGRDAVPGCQRADHV